MRRTVAVISVTYLACGGTSKPPPAAGAGATEIADRATTHIDSPAGTTAFPALDWGMTPDQVRERFPDAHGDASTATFTAHHLHGEGRTATVELTFSSAGLQSIHATFTPGYPSMEACVPDFRTLKRQLDATHGTGAEENLAAYWDTPSTSLQLACNPDTDEGETASLHLYHSIPERD